MGYVCGKRNTSQSTATPPPKSKESRSCGMYTYPLERPTNERLQNCVSTMSRYKAHYRNPCKIKARNPCVIAPD